ncbi:MAG: hypothetical protein R3B09_02200 [Nannocystaceae bacterium]
MLAVALAASSPGCVTAGSEGTSATSTTSGSTTTSSSTGTDGASSTSAAATSTSSTGTTVDGTSSAGSESETAGCMFVCRTDGGVAQPYECDVWDQNCLDGMKCNAWANDGGSAWNSTKCVPVDADPDAVGEPCSVVGSGVSGVDSCDKGAMCWNVDPETNMGVCVGLCQGNEDKCTSDPSSCCPPGSACTIPASGNLILCLQTCDPIIQDCEGSKDACYPVSNGFQCAPDVSGDMGAIGDPCEFINVCDPGTFCGNPGAYPGCDANAAGCCTPFCSLKDPDCVMGTECLAWYDPMDVPPGYEDLGFCVIP